MIRVDYWKYDTNYLPCLHSQYVTFVHDDSLLHVFEVGTVILFGKQNLFPDFRWSNDVVEIPIDTSFNPNSLQAERAAINDKSTINIR